MRSRPHDARIATPARRDVRSRSPRPRDHGRAAKGEPMTTAQPPPAGDEADRRPTVDEMSEWSFPASDPPATWNWEPRAQRYPRGAAASADRPDERVPPYPD